MTTAPSREAAPASGYRYYVLAVLIFVYMLNFLDRQIVGILATPLKAEFGLSDAQFGLMGGLAQQMQGDGLIGVGLQYPPVNALGFRQTAGAVMLDGDGQGFLDGLRLLPGGRLRLPRRLLGQFLLPAFFSPVHFGALPPRPAPTLNNPKQVPRQL